MSKIKKIRIVHEGQPAPHIVARARGKVNHLNLDSVLDVAGKAASTIQKASDAGIVDASMIQDNPSKVSKKEFYNFRDSVYKLITDSGKSLGDIPGNPFSRYSHEGIKDSPLKNYASELAGFKEMLKQYVPEIYAQIMNKSFQAQKDLTNSQSLKLNLEETLKDVSIEYINSLKAKRDTGLTLSNTEQNILNAYEKLRGQVQDVVKRDAQMTVTNFLQDNWIVIVIAALILLMLIFKKK